MWEVIDEVGEAIVAVAEAIVEVVDPINGVMEAIVGVSDAIVRAGKPSVGMEVNEGQAIANFVPSEFNSHVVCLMFQRGSRRAAKRFGLNE